ncbi:MAG: DUF7059 domain-containing protein [Propionibacteriaceae bacterium]
MLDDLAVTSLRAALIAADFTVDAVVDRVGVEAHEALGRNTTIPAVLALGEDRDPLAVLTLLWPLQRAVARVDAERALAGLLPALATAGIVECDRDSVRALVDIRPYDSDDGAAGWIVSDLSPGLDGERSPIRPDFVLGVSPASTTLAQLAIREPVGRALDLGTGCAVQSLHLARHADQVVATDVNPRALDLARLTCRLNEVPVDLRPGSLYEPVAGERFDLIVTNPPYVMAPPSAEGERLTYREGALVGDGLMAEVVRGAADHLNDSGTLQVLGNWAHVAGEDWRDRLAGWITPGGCDALVVQRERLDVFTYVELWLADAGLLGTPDYELRYREWVDYFDSLGIEAVGMGWIWLHRAGRAEPRLRFEEWPYGVEQPIGPAFARLRDALAVEDTRSDADLLATRWILADDVDQETIGAPGDADPRHVVLRQTRGFRRAVEVDTAFGGILGACDGELTLSQLIKGVAALLEVDPTTLATETIPKFRTLILDDFVQLRRS